MEPQFRFSWISNGIYYAIMGSTVPIQADAPLLSSALMSADSLANFERTLEENVQIGVRINEMNQLINTNRAFGQFMKNFQGVETVDPQREHMMFLLYWLNRYVFPNASGNITKEWIFLAEALANCS
ncbi:hypothetical protein Pyn_34237 [Prunus yedoensis var. nudiflora]|uniref:Aminotransferase-like plant mobile domain-containing protein n=1 Tax=Prunus yedoensis var. nudiflora TaxID=2094558 RepID=A0A314YZQ5_PRUYE|nr:hypothetical protein Pyn_34237 [Prunus yedoensis var. nudiflora]